MWCYGTEKAWGEADWKRRLGYRLLGELHVPGRLRSWFIIRALRRLGFWDRTPRALYDAGGGEGAFAVHVARRFPGWRVVVADNEPRTIERADRIKHALGLTNLEIVNVDLREPAEENAYDIVICADVLEHIEEDDRVVQHLSRALKPGGVLLITSPSVPQPRHLPLVAWRERRIGFSPSDYGHVRAGYSEARLRTLFGDAGLAVESIRRTFGPAGTLMFDLFFVTGDSRPNPLVYLALFPLYMLLAAADVVVPSRNGAAIMGVARKPVAARAGAYLPLAAAPGELTT
jgi:2-polyprenyl-3-methyl-5-hydroxy-6-metoxy-1,4-benzoquinol methylase